MAACRDSSLNSSYISYLLKLNWFNWRKVWRVLSGTFRLANILYQIEPKVWQKIKTCLPSPVCSYCLVNHGRMCDYLNGLILTPKQHFIKCHLLMFSVEWTHSWHTVLSALCTVTDVKINKFYFCFRVSFFWLTVQIFTSALMLYQPAYLCLSSDRLLISLTYPHYKSQVTQMGSTAVKGSPVIPLNPESSLKPLHHQRVTGLNRVDTATL